MAAAWPSSLPPPWGVAVGKEWSASWVPPANVFGPSYYSLFGEFPANVILQPSLPIFQEEAVHVHGIGGGDYGLYRPEAASAKSDGPAGNGATLAASAREKVKLENLIRLQLHCISVSGEPAPDAVPPPLSLLPRETANGMREARPSLTEASLSPSIADEVAAMVPPPPGLDVPAAQARWCAKPSMPAESSCGSIGHPRACKGPCKYHTSSRGCKDHQACSRCHLCVWPRDRRATGVRKDSSLPGGAAQQLATAACAGARSDAVVVLDESPPPLAPRLCTIDDEVDSKGKVLTTQNASSADCPQLTLGSLNHPHGCAGACKYFWKRRGCKDGASCDHCHLCVWISPARVGRQRGGSTALAEHEMAAAMP